MANRPAAILGLLCILTSVYRAAELRKLQPDGCALGCFVCSTYSSCTSCLGGFYLIGTACHQCIDSCASCDSSSSCNYCNTGSYYISEAVACRRCPYGCSECNSSFTCTTCSSGFYKNTDGICNPDSATASSTSTSSSRSGRYSRSSSDTSNLSAGAIAGIAGGIVGALVLCIICCYLKWRHREMIRTGQIFPGIGGANASTNQSSNTMRNSSDVEPFNGGQMMESAGYQVTPLPVHHSLQPTKGIQPTTGPGVLQVPPGFGGASLRPNGPVPYNPIAIKNPPINPTAPEMTTIGLNQGHSTFGKTQGQILALPPGFESAQGPSPKGKRELQHGFSAAKGPSSKIQ